MRIKLTQGQFATVDDDMHNILREIKWCASKEINTFYASGRIEINGQLKVVPMHHVVVGVPLNGNVVDHISGNGLDNRRKNLRIVTVRENCGNKKARREFKTTSKYIGVCWSKQGKRWRSAIFFNKKLIFIGHFKNEENAGKAYQEASNQLMAISNKKEIWDLWEEYAKKRQKTLGYPLVLSEFLKWNRQRIQIKKGFGLNELNGELNQ